MCTIRSNNCFYLYMSFSRVIFFQHSFICFIFLKKNSMTVVTPTYPSQFFKLESFGLISKSNVCRKNHTGIGRSKQVQGKLNCIRIYFILNTWILFIFGNGHFSHSLAQSNDQLTNSTHVSVPCSLGNIY